MSGRGDADLGPFYIDSLSPEDLLALLSPSQREAFDSTLRDPARVTALVREEFEGDLPWWAIEKEEPLEGENQTPEEEDEEDPAVQPDFVEFKSLPALKLAEDGKPIGNPRLVFNVVAVLFVVSILFPDTVELTPSAFL